jgi:hypothetical protein
MGGDAAEQTRVKEGTVVRQAVGFSRGEAGRSDFTGLLRGAFLVLRHVLMVAEGYSGGGFGFFSGDLAV